MAGLQEVTIQWKGSFQCRLATDPAPSTAQAPAPDSNFANGWTFPYGEAHFDRRFRLADPVALRTALVEPWNPVKVTRVELRFVGSSRTDTSLNGQAVSYTQPIFFGRAPGAETLKGLDLSIGVGPLFDLSGTPKVPSKLTGARSDPSRSGAAYKRLKAPLVSKVTEPDRKNLLTLSRPDWIDTYGSFWAMRAETRPVELKDVQGSATFDGVPVAAFDWTFKTAFSGFDGDTLVGSVRGEVIGKRNAMPYH